MSVTFAVCDRWGPGPVEVWLTRTGDEEMVNTSATLAVRVGAALGLEEFSDRERGVPAGGGCAAAVLLERLGRWPDGHPDPEVTRLLGELLALVRTALAADPDAVICWG